MSDEIISKLGFDVSQALQALDNLDAKMKMVGETMKRFGEVAKASSAAASALDKVGRASKGIDDAKRSVDSLTVSWSMMGRIVTTQLIVRALSQLRRTFEDTAASLSVTFVQSVTTRIQAVVLPLAVT